MRKVNMKKAVVTASLAAAFALGAMPAHATFCVNSDSFSDKLQMEIVPGGGNVYGDWDYTAGITIAPCQGNILPTATGPALNCSGWRPDLLINIKAVVNLTGGTVEYWIYDGASPAFLINTDTVTLTPGACVFSAGSKGYATE